MEEILPQFSNIRNLTVNSEAVNHLKPAMCWAKIISILGFVSSGIAFASAIVLFFFAETVLGPVGWIYRSSMHMAGALCLCGAIVQFILYFFLLNASTTIKKAIVSGDNDSLAKGSHCLKLYFMICGITTIISWTFVIACCVLALLSV